MNAKQRAMIQREYADADGFWIDLAPGWVVRGDAHGIVENTKREARAKLAEVIPCGCAECRELIAASKGNA